MRSLVKNVSLLFSGAAAAHAITLLSTPLLSRLFTPESFGQLGVLLAVTGVLVVVSSLRYELAIIVARDDEDAAALFSLAILLCSVVSAGSAAMVVAFGSSLAGAMGDSVLAYVLLLAPVAILSSGTHHAASNWLVRRRAYRSAATNDFVKASAQVIGQVTAGSLHFGGMGLTAGHVTGQTLAAVFVFRRVWLRDHHIIRRNLALRRLRAVAHGYRDFAMFSAPQGFLSALSQNAAIFAVAAYYSTTEVGQLVIALRAMQLPISVLSNSVSRAFLQQASSLVADRAPLLPLTLKATGGLFAVAVLPTTAIAVWGPSIFALILGSEWAPAGDYARSLVFWLALLVVNPPALAIFRALRRERIHLMVVALQLIARVGILVGAGHYGSDSMLAISLFSAVGVVFNLLLIGIGIMLAHKQDQLPRLGSRGE